MQNLPDTHTLLWYFKEDNQLSGRAKNLIQDQESINYISIVSLWEMAVKISINKLKITEHISSYIRDIMDNNFAILPIKNEEISLASSMPLIHRDPFDRMIIAQALNNQMQIITSDSNICRYNVTVFW